SKPANFGIGTLAAVEAARPPGFAVAGAVAARLGGGRITAGEEDPAARVSAHSLAADHRHALDLDQPARPAQAADRDQRAAREAFLEDLLADLGEAVAEPRVGDEHRHGDEVLEPGAAHRLDGLVQRIEDLAHLVVEARRRRAGLPAQPHDLAALGDD